MTLNGIALLPILGVFKWGDEAADVAGAAAKHSDEVGTITKQYDTLIDESGNRIKGKWVSPQDWANLKANDILKKWKESGVGAGARSGQHGTPFNSAAKEIQQLAKDKNLLPEVREQLLKKAKEYLMRAKNINHKM